MNTEEKTKTKINPRVWDALIAFIVIGGGVWAISSLVSLAMAGNWYVVFYLFTIVGGIGDVSAWFTVAFGIIGLTGIVWFLSGTIDDNLNYNSESLTKRRQTGTKIILRILPYFLICLLIVIATPTRKEMALIVAGGAVGQFVANDENAQKIPSELVQLLRGEILKATSDLSNEAKTELGIKSEAERKLEELQGKSKEELLKLLIDDTSMSK